MEHSNDNDAEDKQVENTSSQARPEATKAVIVLLDSMLAHQNDESVQLKAILSLLRMSLNDAERKLVGDSGCIQPVIADLTLFPRNEHILYNGCKLLANVAFNCDDNKNRIRQCNGIDVIVNVMKEEPNNEELHIHASLVLRNATHGCRKNQLRARVIGAIDVLSDTLKRFPCNKKIQTNTISAVGNIACASMDCQMRIRESECIELVLFAMSQHASSSTVQNHSMVAIRNICNDNEKNQQRVGEKGGVKLIAAAMNSFRDDWELLVIASEAVRVLCLDGKNRETVGEVEIISPLVQSLGDTLERSQNMSDFVSLLKALSNAVFSPASNREKLISEHGVEAVMECIQKRKSNLEVVEGGLRVFRNVVDDGGDRCKCLGNSRVFSFAVEVMLADRRNAGICEHALALLLRAAVLPYDEDWIGMEAGKLKEIVQEQLEIHDFTIAIQKIGQKLLRSFWTETELTSPPRLGKLKSKDVFSMIRRLGSHS